MTQTSQLPALTDERPATPEQVAYYRENGHVLVRGIASTEEIAQWGPVIKDVTLAHSDEDRSIEQDETVRDAIMQIQNLWLLDECVREFVFAPRFARVAADLLGVDALRIYHDQAVFKPAGGANTPFHQDQYFFPLDGDEIVTMWIPLVPITAEMGSMTFASGSHQLGSLGDLALSDTSERYFQDLVQEKGIPLHNHGAMALGDATFHGGWTLHTAPPNPTPHLRAVMTVIWYADGLRGIEPQHHWHEKDYAKWLPGVAPGDLAASDINPVVWRRS